MRILLLAALLAFAATATADGHERIEEGDVLLIEKIERSAGMATPRLGMRMAQVEAEFGEPVTRSEPVGDPPITRWRYESFTVYFEGETVLHAVVDREAVGLKRPS
ncbi:MAG: hypothetical protein AAGE01_09935 [Pseudomonadota bacterium]